MSLLPRRFPDSVPLALLWRYATHSVMLGLSMIHESRPAPRLPDTLHAVVPFVPEIWRWNYHIWVAAQLPVALWLWRRNRTLFLRFLWIGGVLSLLRGVMVPLTGLGPIQGPDVNAGLSPEKLFTAWLNLVNPFSTLAGDAAHVHLTKDMFFSGHVATSFLLWLYARKVAGVGAAALVAHLVVTATVILSHLHYTIDVVGAWAVTFSVYVLAEGWSRPTPDEQLLSRRRPNADVEFPVTTSSG